MNDFWKNVSIFTTGILLGMIIMGLVTVTVYENKVGKLQTSIDGTIQQVNAFTETMRWLDWEVTKCYETAGTSRMVVEDGIQMWRDEVNNYARAIERME